MFNGMMDPELMRLAQEQMSRIPPDELMKMQQQMMANPALMKMATESMKDLKPEDLRFAAEQMKNVREEDMAEIRDRMSNASPDQIAAMQAQAEAQSAYQLQGAQNLKYQGNQLHAEGKYSEAAEKYLQVKSNLRGIAFPKSKSLITACSLNLMSCYLKTRQYKDCIQVGSEVLAYDPMNVKALYRRGQAYKWIGNLELAVVDLSKAVEVSPEDETIAQVLREARAELQVEGESQYDRNGPRIEEITEEEAAVLTTKNEIKVPQSTPLVNSVSEHNNAGKQGSEDLNTFSTDRLANNAPSEDAYAETLRSLGENPDMIRNMQSLMANVSPESMAALSGGKMTSEMVKTASEMFSRMSPDELQKMIKMSTSFQTQNHTSSPFDDTNRRTSTTGSQTSRSISEEIMQSETNVNKIGDSRASFNPSVPFSGMPDMSTEIQDQMRNQMKDPATRQMFTTMIQNMSPETMASMGEQFGLKLSREDAVKAQNAMASLSPDDLDKLMNWAARLQRIIDYLRNMKNWMTRLPQSDMIYMNLESFTISRRLSD
ncbi:hypothetical protein SUGI_0628740 [Cryptomeria japonica]|nr:hypothetical protein SUGI_0628740 [Cryptomeria japonica]